MSEEQEQDKLKVDDLISVAEAAKLRGVSVQAIWYRIKQEKLKSTEISGYTFVSKASIEELTFRLKNKKNVV